MRRLLPGSALLLAAVLLTACSDDAPDAANNPSVPATTATPSATPTPGAPGPAVLETVATGLDTPWGLAFLPDGSALVTERDSGRVLQIRGLAVKEVGRIEEAPGDDDEAGLMGVAVSPDFATDQRLYFYVTTPADNRIVRTTLTGDKLGRIDPILTGIPTGHIHDGGRLVFGPDGYLYASTGETGDGDLAQDRDSLAGKILRITPDGDPAPGNPDPESPVWSWGHRNVQGLAFDDEDRLWASEFGAQAFDELNLIEKGGNYGWPQVEGSGKGKGLINPHVVWKTSEASPSGLAFRQGQLWMASLRGERLWRIDVTDGRATNATDFFVGTHGRIRTVAVAPNGNLWVTTSNKDGRGEPTPGDDRILVIRP